MKQNGTLLSNLGFLYHLDLEEADLFWLLLEASLLMLINMLIAVVKVLDMRLFWSLLIQLFYQAEEMLWCDT